jgi:hypothetical protein
MKYTIQLLISVLLCVPVFSQNVGIGTSSPHASAQLDISNSGKGLLIPRMTTANISAITNPAKGLLVYDSVLNQLMVNMGNDVAPDWQTIVFKSGWGTAGNSGTDTAVNFIGTKDNRPLRFKVNNQSAGLLSPAINGNTGFGWETLLNTSSGTYNTAIGNRTLRANTTGTGNFAVGFEALFSNTTGSYNVANGGQALRTNTIGNYNVANGVAALQSNISGNSNVANGMEALNANTTGVGNVANGVSALKSNTTGNVNVANGGEALFSNTTGIENTATGYHSLYQNTVGNFNTATGAFALNANTTAGNNTAHGYGALYNNLTGSENTANGVQALFSNTTGTANVANGALAGYFNTTGLGNVANGLQAMYKNTVGDSNTVNGTLALYNNTIGNENVADGFRAMYFNATGSYNTAIGSLAGGVLGANPSNFTAIGYDAGKVNSVSNRMEFGNTSVNWIGGQVGWSTYSDRRIKEDIHADIPGLSFITRLKPVSYRLNIKMQNALCGIDNEKEWEGKYDIEKEIQTGFIAQEVEQAAQELGFKFSGVSAPKGAGKLYSVQYAAFVVPLVKAVQEQQQIIDKQQQQIDVLTKQVEALMKKGKN